ncbi:TetR/AcrR family transcriptional regulator [Mycobacterium sp. MBM]|nr:TetR/AcrR family transcriptional regulator [Mycobacterium sp. MBM]
MNRQATRSVRTGGRSARIRTAILTATFEELVDGGYATLSVDAIARRAGVNKTTVYRRWPTLDDLLLDALKSWSVEAVPVPDTGSIDADLRALGSELADALNTGAGRQIAAYVLTAGLKSPGLSEATRRYFDHQAVRATPVVTRAIARGELPGACDANQLLTTFRAPLFYRMVTTGDPIDSALIDLSVQVALTAARAGLLNAGGG